MFKRAYIRLIFIFILMQIFGISFLYIINLSIIKDNIKNSEMNFTNNNVKIQANFIKNIIDEGKKNLEILINTNNFEQFFKGKNKLKIETLFYDYISTRNDFLQMRVIDKNGIEKLRVQKYDKDITAMIIDEKKLQNKSFRIYFKEGIKLKKNEFLITNFNLNVENNKIETPYQPTLRIITPIVERSQTLGILVINLNMQRFLDFIKNIENFDVYLIDKNGNYLLNPDKQKEWSKDLKTNYNIKNDFEKEIAFNIGDL